MKQVVLVIRDGWGIGKPDESNAVYCAQTPNTDRWLSRYPHCVLEAAGRAVGVPDGNQGSSEVGHLNMGAGRIVKQELLRVNEALENGSLFWDPRFKELVENCQRNASALHLMGLVQDEGVHAHQDHLFRILEHVAKAGLSKVYIHFFADGRDTPPRSAMRFYGDVERVIQRCGVGEIATVMGRYYAMDRAEVWPLTLQAYRLLTEARGLHASTGQEAIEIAYRDHRTPDDYEMTDEYIPPFVIGDFPGIQDGDSVIHFNYRQDRAIQLTRLFVDEESPVPGRKKVNVVYRGLTRYYDSFTDYLLEPIDDAMPNLLGEILAQHGLRQLRISETQKFRHVTSFFNGKQTVPFQGEDQIEIKSIYDPSSFASHPEMNAVDIMTAVVNHIRSQAYSFVVVNFANCDMVGHTGDFGAAMKAVEVVDACVGHVIEAVLTVGGVALVTADHGNVEEMLDLDTGGPKTSHSTNPVHLIYVADDASAVTLRPHGILSDIAPTVLELMGLAQPIEMTSQSLLLHSAG